MTSWGPMLILLGAVIVFVTFFHMLLNARTMAKLAKDVSPEDMRVGPGSERKTASKGVMLGSLLLHFVGWGLIVLAWLGMGGSKEVTDQDPPLATAESTAPAPTNRDMGPATPVTSAPPAQAGTQQNNGADATGGTPSGAQATPGAGSAEQGERKPGY